MTQKAYKLTRDHDRFQDGEVEIDPHKDGYLESRFPNWRGMEMAFFSAVPITLGGTEGKILRERKNRNIIGARMPEEIIFAGLKDWLSPTDYPYIYESSTWPVISKRMLDVLLSVGEFPHQVIPVSFVNVYSPKYSEEEWLAKIPLRNNDYIILQLLELSDVFDMEKSKYNTERGLANPDEIIICDVQNMVLKEPMDGFPPIFRVKGNDLCLHISAEAKQALEDAGIQGLDFDTYGLETP
jgi:hypothetical protein